jgi:FkbM family methyltransferase
MSFRIKSVQFLIHHIERLFFYPKLSRYYIQKNLPSTPTIIDVGANKGQSIDFFLKLYPNATIHAFEPNPNLYAKLVKKYNAYSTVFLYNQGVSNKSGVYRFYENILDETSSFEKVNTKSIYLKKKSLILGANPESVVKKEYDVRTTSLADFFIELDIKFVDILKIDVEGHEGQCIEGLISMHHNFMVNFIQLEEHHDDLYNNHVLNIEIPKVLENIGLKLETKIKHPFGNFYELIYVNQLEEMIFQET